MPDIGCRPITRIKGKPALVRRLRGLLVAVHRYAHHRATCNADRQWSARLLDALTLAVDVADPPPSLPDSGSEPRTYTTDIEAQP